MPARKKPTPAQSARAARLREIIAGAAVGAEPPAPKSPREITDAAALRKWERLRKQK